MSDYGSQDVKCPFYKGESKNIIKCEGAINDICTQPFRSKKKKEIHKSEYCNTFNCKECPYYKMLNQKYE